MLCAVRAEIDNPERVKGMAEGEALWGRGMEQNVQKKGM